MSKDFKLKVSPRMLELLSKDLYTNMYFVLAELIANAYDADAENVYIFIDEKEIRIEDDGSGMTAAELDEKYLLVGGESRSSEFDSRTKTKKRLKMGRKGVGKLAALCISRGFKIVTVKEGQAIGLFIPHQIEHDDEILKVLDNTDFELKKITSQGTAIIMESPKISIPKTQGTIMRNLAKIFPNGIDDFKIHIIYNGKEELLVPDEKDVIKNLASFISVGGEKQELAKLLSKDEKNIQSKSIDYIKKNVELFDSNGELRTLEVKVYGWIGTVRSTRDMKKDLSDFSDNYLAVFAHNKMGIRNILPIIGKNRVYDSYVVGNLYIDAFESPDFPDMASTNRQGYNESDPRWVEILPQLRELLDDIVRMHAEYAKLLRADKESQKEEKKAKKEEELKQKLNEVTEKIKENLSKTIVDSSNKENIDLAITREVEDMKALLGFKSSVDANKKKIMISHTYADNAIAKIIYKMLLFNGVPKEDIIYSNGPDPETNLPETDIYDYLRKFFIHSASNEMIYVLFVTSKNVYNNESENKSASWGVLMEIGAAWVTKKDHWIFNINNYRPETPLNVQNKWVSIQYTKNEDGTENITLTEAMVNSFCNKIIMTCSSCNYQPKSFEDNKEHLINNYIELI